MIDLYILYNRFCSEYNTYQGGFYRPERDFEQAVNSINQSIWNEWTNMAEKTQEITDELCPFLKTINLIVKQTNSNYGLAEYPKNYGRYSSARLLVHDEDCFEDYNYPTYKNGTESSFSSLEKEQKIQERTEKYKDGISETNVYKIDNSKWGAILEHRTKKPTFEEPAITQYDNGFKVAPRTVSVVILDYYIKPVNGKFSYKLSAPNLGNGEGDVIIYDELNSVKLQWNETMIPYFLKRLGEYYSKYTRDGQLFQMTQASK